MPTTIPFDPATPVPTDFLASLDGQVYSCATPWSFYGQRRYLGVRNPNTALVVFRALVSSPIGHPIESIEWSNGRAAVKTTNRHCYVHMATANLVISDCLPDVLNGAFPCYISGLDTFEYDLPTPVRNVTKLGKVDYNVNLVANYFFNSTMVFREGTSAIEVNP